MNKESSDDFIHFKEIFGREPTAREMEIRNSRCKPPFPMAEVICWSPFNDSIHLIVCGVISTKDHLGNKIIPTYEIHVSFGDSKNLYKEVRNLSIRSAKDIARRIIEMCDFAEKDPSHAS